MVLALTRNTLTCSSGTGWPLISLLKVIAATTPVVGSSSNLLLPDLYMICAWLPTAPPSTLIGRMPFSFRPP